MCWTTWKAPPLLKAKGVVTQSGTYEDAEWFSSI